jgi:periplasmic protein TonB
VSEADLSVRAIDATAGPDRPARVAIVAVALALLLHILIALWLLIGWHDSETPESQTIQVTLLTLPPPAPPPPPAPEPQKDLSARQSGPDQVTTAAPRATESAPEAETPQAAAPPSETAAPPEAPPVATGLEPPPEEKPKPPTPPAPQTPKPKLALRAPDVAPPIDRVLGDKDATGDPYLNALWSRIERNREPTTPVGPAGLHLEGITVFGIVLDHQGHMDQLKMLSSSGSQLLDDEARRMIVAATPFPAPPADYPDLVPLRVTIHLYPQ